ncbi:MAG TPA: serine hydrolase [Candidatus Nanoarchaeia archaeon]|nr:hypothetical protein [uncultured archaeon]
MIKKRYKIAAAIAAIIFLVFLPHSNLLNKVGDSLSEGTVLEKDTPKTETKKEPPKIDREPLKAKLLTDLTTYLSANQNFTVGIHDINNNETFGIRETEMLHAASIMKVLVATAAFEEVETGKYSLNTPLGGNTYQFQLQQMINQSNNYSWDYFNNLLGFKREQETADRLGLTAINVFQNHMSAVGVSELLLKLYKGEVLKTEHRDLLFSYMQNTETENRISPAVPAGVNFYHKTGTFEGGFHDAALVIHPKNPFILVIFTYDLTGLPHTERAAAIQNAASAVYTYFSSI